MVEPNESVHAKELRKDTANRYLRFQRNRSEGISARRSNTEF
jgi:hypothetical protein